MYSNGNFIINRCNCLTISEKEHKKIKKSEKKVQMRATFGARFASR